MLSTLVQTALVVAFTVHHVAADIQFNTPTLTQCQDASLEWTGGTPPYNLYVVPSSDSCADSVVDIPEQSGTSFNWKVNIPAGSSVEILVEDSTEDEGWTGIITVANGTDSSCVDKKAAQALGSSNSPTSSSPASSLGETASSAASSLAASKPTTVGAPAATVQPASAPGPDGLANAADGQGNTPQSSGSMSRAALPAGSLFATAAFVLALAHL